MKSQYPFGLSLSKPAPFDKLRANELHISSGRSNNEWSIFAHPLFLGQIEELIQQVEKLRKKYPDTYQDKNASKRLAAVYKLVFEVIPQEPSRAEYRQGDTLGEEYKHWFRAKFFQQYRLFFRYHEKSKVIVFAWVNDEDSKRAYASNSDAYRIFSKMLKNGHPPDDWNNLLAEARKIANPKS